MIRNYEFILSRFQKHFGNIELESITPDDILGFMTKVSGKTKQNTKKLRFTLIAAFFNYIKISINTDFKNPCDNQALKRLFRSGKNIQFKYLKKMWLMKLFLGQKINETGSCSNSWHGDA